MYIGHWNWRKLTLILTLLHCPQIVLAKGFVDQVRDQLVRAAVVLGVGDNYQLTHDPVVSTIRSKSTKTHTLTLDAGIPYVIVGVCDNDCGDIDLRLYNDEDDVVSSDMDTDDDPMLRVSSQQKAKFKLEVIMENCSTLSCYYGIGIFGQKSEEISQIEKNESSPEQVVRDYYNNLDKGQVDAALDKWNFSSDSQERRIRGLADGVEWFKLNQMKLMSANSKSATVSAEVSGKKEGQASGRWSVTIDLEKISGEWKITNIRGAR